MTTVEESPCPICKAGPGALSIDMRLTAKPLGSFSLSGAQMKYSATTVPTLVCSICGFTATGRIDEDGRHVTFDRREDDDDDEA